MVRTNAVTRWSIGALALVLSLWACRGKEDRSVEVSPVEQVPSPTEESVSNPEEPVAEPSPPGETPGGSAPETATTPAAREAPPPPPPPLPAVEEVEERESAPSPATDTLPMTPPPPPPQEIVEVLVPAGTVLELELLTPLDTSVSRVGDEIEARTISAVLVNGEPVLPRGTYVEGRVTEVEASGRVKGRAKLAFIFDRLSTRSGLKEIRTSYVTEEAKSRSKKDAGVIGGAAGIGAVVGGIIGGKKGAAIGATIGGAGGTGVVLATKGEEIRLPVGTPVNVRLDEPVALQLN